MNEATTTLTHAPTLTSQLLETIDMTQKYFIPKPVDIGADIKAWYHHCYVYVWPCVTVTIKGRFAVVDWDYATLRESFEPILRAKEDVLTKGFLAIHKRYANRMSPPPLVDAFRARFFRLRKEAALCAAEDLSDYLCAELGLEGPEGHFWKRQAKRSEYEHFLRFATSQAYHPVAKRAGV